MAQTRVTIGLVFKNKFEADWNEGLMLALQDSLARCLKDFSEPIDRVEIVWFEDQDEWENRARVLRKLATKPKLLKIPQGE
jgi:hypothetical protein